jgi:hypothetical protein
MWSDQPGREPFSVRNELRFVMWGGVTLIASGVGVIVSKHLDDIGPLTVAVVLGAAAMACYAYAWWKRSRAASLVDDYVLLLGALLLSSDAGFIDHQYHLLGARWLPLLAIAHAVVAYVYDSRLVLSLSIGALAAWLGVERSVNVFFRSDLTQVATRALLCAAVVVVWRLLNRRRAFNDVFDHAAAHLAFVAGVLLAAGNEPVGLLVTAAVAVLAVWIGLRRGSEAFVVYAWIYATATALAFVWERVTDETPAMLATIVIIVVMVIGTGLTHARFRRKARP